MLLAQFRAAAGSPSGGACCQATAAWLSTLEPSRPTEARTTCLGDGHCFACSMMLGRSAQRNGIRYMAQGNNKGPTLLQCLYAPSQTAMTAASPSQRMVRGVRDIVQCRCHTCIGQSACVPDAVLATGLGSVRADDWSAQNIGAQFQFMSESAMQRSMQQWKEIALP